MLAGGLLFGDQLFASLGLDGACWFVLRMQMHRLSASFKGDIDLLAGRLEWAHPEEFQARCEEDSRKNNRWSPFLTTVTLAAEGGIKWPPSTNYLVAVEAKSAYQDPGAAVISPETLKSTKASCQKKRQMRRSIEHLFEMGFDRVALLDLIANPPVGGPGSESWFNAGTVAGRSREAMNSVLQDRLPSQTSAGHWVLSIGAIESGLEHERGALSQRMLREASNNPQLAASGEVRANRKEIEGNLLRVLEDFPQPKNLSVVFDDCPTCGRVHPQPFCGLC